MVSRHAVAVASRSRPPCLGRVISTTRAGPETHSGPALPKHSRTRWGTTTLSAVGGGPCQGGRVGEGTTTLAAVGGGPCQGGRVAGGHHHARSCRWWALPGRGCGGRAPARSQLLVVGPAREGMSREGTTTLAAVGGGPCPGGCLVGRHHHARSCWWWALLREGVWWGATRILGACALATLSCPPRSWSFFSLELYATAGTAALHHSEPQTGISGRDSLPWICLLFWMSRHRTLVLGRITRMPVDHLRHPCQRAAAMLRGVGRGSIRLTLHCASQRFLSGECTIGWEITFPGCRGSPWRRHVALNRRF